MTKYLVDTCVWRDYYEDRKNRIGKKIGAKAFVFIQKILVNRTTTYISNATIQELISDYGEKETGRALFLVFASKNISVLHPTKSEALEAKKLSKENKLPFVDCLIALQARNQSAFVVTRDKHFFKQLKNICKSVRPEDAF